MTGRYIAKAAVGAGIVAALSGCPLNEPASNPGVYYDFVTNRVVAARPVSSDDSFESVPSVIDPSSDAHELQKRASAYLRGIGRTDGDTGVSAGIRYRFRPGGEHQKSWEVDLRANDIHGTIAGQDGDPDDDFSSQKLRAAGSFKWKAGDARWKASLGIDAYFRGSADGHSPDINSAGLYLAVGAVDPSAKFKWFVSGSLLGGEWDYGVVSGADFSQSRLFAMARWGFEQGWYAGAEFELLRNDYGTGNPLDEKTEFKVVGGKRDAGSFRDIQASLGPEKWEHRFSDDQDNLEMTVQASVPLIDKKDKRLDLTMGVEFSDEIGFMVGLQADW